MSAEEFLGTARFKIHQRLGAGGFGVVYHAFDVERETHVALKVLREANADSLYRFKHEFRSLADLVHPNLVRLFELLTDGTHWFFTMELVHGVNFVDFVADRALPGPDPTERSPGGYTPATDVTLKMSPVLQRATAGGLARLRRTLPQVVSAIQALHRAGKLHRDIKPSNVLVRDDGTVTLLDFGLVTDSRPEQGLQSLQIVGTPVYMSPEQAAGLPIDESSDWYALGVMLYESLTGRPPFSGSLFDIATQKQTLDPPPPKSVVDGVPLDLDRLCCDLLDRNPALRPHARAILSRLGSAEPVHVPSNVEQETVLVGREKQLRTLRQAFQNVLAGGSEAVAVAGPSGIGKTSLIRSFLHEISNSHPEAVILAGRCYQRESVPYKGVDTIIDELQRYLRRVPSQQMEALLPLGFAAVEQLFPVLRGLGDALRTRLRAVGSGDQQELRRRAFLGLREMLVRLADRRPLVIFIDDAQSGDLDSAELLREVLRSEEGPSLLFILAYRSEERDTSPFLRRLYESDMTSRLGLRELRLEQLSPDESRRLAVRLLEDAAVAADDVANVIAEESAGSPFLIDALAKSATQAGLAVIERAGAHGARDSDARELTIRELLNIRVSRIGSDARRVLSLAAINRRPIQSSTLRDAFAGPNFHLSLETLRSEHLIRSRSTDHGEELEVYHDKISEALVAMLTAEERGAMHGALASALMRASEHDAELLADHFLAADDLQNGTRFVIEAADAAEKAFAFDRAVRLYRRALELVSADRQNAIRRRLADALANAGRGPEAAAVYLSIPATELSESLELKRRAAQQLLFSGHVDEGLAVTRDLLTAVDIPYPETRYSTLAALLKERLKLKLRGIRFHVRQEPISPDELLRLDVCRSASLSLGMIDTIRGAVFQTRYLLYALAVGDPDHLVQALAVESGYSAVRGSKHVKRTAALFRKTRELARVMNTPLANAYADVAEGIAATLEGRWRTGAAFLAEAEELLQHGTGVTWEFDTARLFALRCYYFMGEVRLIREEAANLLRDGYERGDRYFTTNLALFSHYRHLAGDEPAKAAAEIENAIREWSHTGFHVQHVWHLRASVDVALYEDRGLLAWTRVQQSWRAARGSLLARVQFTRVGMEEMRGRAAVAAAATSRSGKERRYLLGVARRTADRMRAERAPWATALAELITAGADMLDGREARAVDRLAATHELLLRLDMRLHAAAVAWRLAELQNTRDQQAASREAREWTKAQGIRDPSRMVRMILPFSRLTTR